MTRSPQEELDKLREQGTPIYSFSKIESMHGCLYEAYRTYILHERDMQKPNCYAVLGSSVHDVLEKIMNGKATEKDLFPAVQRDLDMCSMLDITFPNDSVRDNWIKDMTHFCNTYIRPKGKFETETFFLYKTPQNHYIQGYIDLTRLNKDGTIDIYDYKTSSLYKGDDIKVHSRQLILYGLGKETQGYKVRKVGWIFLKYVQVEFMGKKTAKSKQETLIVKIIERKNIVKELAPYIESKLGMIGLDEIEIEFLMQKAFAENEIPEPVLKQFVLKPYVMYYDYSEETKSECNEYLDRSINEWENLGTVESDFPHIPFTKLTKMGKEIENTFYCNCLCGYRHDCKYLSDYNIRKENIKSEYDDLF